MRVLFLTNTPPKGPSARYRVYQFLPHLGHYGIKASCHSALTPRLYDKFKPSGGMWSKILYFGLSALSRVIALFRLAFYDTVYIQKLVLPHVYPFPEVMLCKLGKLLGKRIIFDYDDAIFTISEVRKKTWVERFTCPGRLQRVIELCDGVVAGNNFLADYARGYNKNVCVLPTCVELAKYPAPKPKYNWGDPVVIGWIGTPSTLPYLDLIRPALQQIAQKQEIILRIVGGKEYHCPGVKVECLPWTLDGEVELIKSFNIGVMPLTDDAWSRGKCGLKLLQYMAAGVPAIASPVGVNSEIIQDGLNGYLAAGTTQWVEVLEIIMSNPAAHAYMAEKARETVEKEYAVESNIPKLVDILKDNSYYHTPGVRNE
ncbi:MAG: glycosyltransferase family 4 protein [Desulfotomaculaceae bacterium]